MSRWHPKTEWDKAEDAFRVFAFLVFYDRTLRTERPRDWRFLHALQLSSRPIPAARREHILAWYRREHPYCNRQDDRRWWHERDADTLVLHP